MRMNLLLLLDGESPLTVLEESPMSSDVLMISQSSPTVTVMMSTELLDLELSALTPPVERDPAM